MAGMEDEVGDVKRTPKADPVTGGQMGRPHPALRKYAATYEAVSLSEALERLGARKNGELGIIKGGLDDNSKEVELHGPGAELPSANSTSHLNPKGGTSYDPFIGGVADEEPRDNSETETMEDVRRRLMEARPGSVEAEVPTSRKRQRRKAEQTLSQTDLVPIIEQYARMKMEVEQAVRRLESVGRPEHGNPGQTAPVPVSAMERDPSKEARGKRIRVELSLDAMTFSVPAVDLVECRYGATLFIPSSGESMTFVPTVGAEVVLTRQGGSPIKTHFTGISFQVPGQEVMGLAFVRKSEPAAGAATEGSDAPV